jgi:hypothetical protein
MVSECVRPDLDESFAVLGRDLLLPRDSFMVSSRVRSSSIDNESGEDDEFWCGSEKKIEP